MIDKHVLHPHKPRNVNALHKMEQATSSLNQKIAIFLTKIVGTMVCAYFFTILALLGLPGWGATPAQWVQWISQTLIQLVMLSVIMVGQGLLGRHQELQAEEQFKMTSKTCHDNEVISHQNEVIIGMLDHLLLIEQQKAEAAPQHVVSVTRRRRKTADANQ